MKINGAITMLAGDDGVSFEIRDDDAAILFAEFKLTPKQFCQAMSRLSHIPCPIEVQGIQKVGKIHECKKHEFELPDDNWTKREETAKRIAQKTCPEGWEPDAYFDSQDSFFTRDGKPWARTMIRRWVEKK